MLPITADASRGWFTAYATSEDGISWEQHGLVIDRTSCKDVAVIYLNGTYFRHFSSLLYRGHNGVSHTVSENGIDLGFFYQCMELSGSWT